MATDPAAYHECKLYADDWIEMDNEDICPQCDHLACSKCEPYTWIMEWVMGVEQEDELAAGGISEEDRDSVAYKEEETAEVVEGMETQDPYDWENDEK
jgi:hypothetical protein